MNSFIKENTLEILQGGDLEDNDWRLVIQKHNLDYCLRKQGFFQISEVMRCWNYNFFHLALYLMCFVA